MCANEQVSVADNWASVLLGECVAHTSELSHPRGEVT